MTKNEKTYLMEQIRKNTDTIAMVEKGELWSDIYKTEEQRLAFVQGAYMMNEVFDRFING